jgi:hypothetical protein
MLVMMSLQLYTVTGGVQMRFFENLQKLSISSKNDHLCKPATESYTCVCAAGAAHAAPGGRAARLLDLTANEERTTRSRRGAGADPESEILGFFENSKIINFQSDLFGMKRNRSSSP